MGKPYHYYDTPDGEDVLKKLWFVLKPATLATIGIGTCDVILYSYPKGYLATLARYAYLGIPILGMTTTFVLVANTLCNIRKKDDIWNWVGAGASVGTILGAWRGSPQVGTVSAGIFGFVGGVHKYCHQNGIVVIPNIEPRMHGGLQNVRHDCSLIPDTQGEWKKKYV